MENLDISRDLVRSSGRGRRFRLRPLPLGQEEAAANAAHQPIAEKSLASYIPSPLISTDKRMAALAVGGAPAWSRRLRRIDTLTDAALADLASAWRGLAKARRRSPARFAAEWLEHAATFDFAHVNDLIRRHNLYFPAEANLAMDVHTGDYIGIGGGDYRRQPLDTAWVLAHFPTDLAAALDESPMATLDR